MMKISRCQTQVGGILIVLAMPAIMTMVVSFLRRSCLLLESWNTKIVKSVERVHDKQSVLRRTVHLGVSE